MITNNIRNKNWADLIIDRIDEGIYDPKEITKCLIRWIGWGRHEEFLEVLQINELLLEEDLKLLYPDLEDK